MKKPRLILAGTQSGVGKTSVSAGLMAALTRQGQYVQPWKVGPDYIDPAFHAFVTGRQSRNLDSWILDEPTLLALFQANAPDSGQGLSIIEGVMGLFDGHIGSGRGSTAHVAEVLKTPVVLIINGAAVSRSAAALVHGFNTFQPNLSLSGVIVNQVSGLAHYEIIKNFVEKEAGIPCFGYLVKNTGIALESRHLGLVPSVEVEGLKNRLELLATAASETLDLEGLIALAHSAPDFEVFPKRRTLDGGTPVRLGLAKDQAFNFYYQDGLDLLTSLGAVLVPFSPLHDSALPPDLDGLYIGGGFPEMFGAQLEANRSLRAEILVKLEEGLPAYGECGGLMYLTESLTDLEGRTHEMVGFFPKKTVMTKKLQNFGYVTVTYEQDTILGPVGTSSRAHEFHHSCLEGEDSAEVVATISKSATRSWTGGLARKKVLATYPHLHFWANPEVAVNFLTQCRQYKQSKI